jgi:hypothetical protein
MFYGVHVAGGSDSWGYVSQSELWLERDLIVEQPIATQVPWPEGDSTFAPLGYRPAVEKGAIVPVYAPGLPVLMALATLIVGACGPFVVIPLLGGLTVLLAYRLGTQVWSAGVGLASAALVASSATFVYMLLNPMSDVAVSAFFLAGLVAALSQWRSRAFWTGAAVSVAIFIRPNLVPIGAVFLAMILVRAGAGGHRWRAFAGFALGGLPLVLAVAAVNAHLYGAPWKAGYGSLDVFYAWSYLVPNVVQYGRALLRTETPVVLFAAVPLFLLNRVSTEQRRALIFLAAFVAAVWISYLFYTPYDAWWYLRFLLPAFPPMLVLAAAGVVVVTERLGGARTGAALALLIAMATAALRIGVIRDEGVLGLRQTGVVYLSVANYVRTSLPANAVLLSVEHSGSLRHYTGRLTMRWDLLPPEWWPKAVDELVRRGFRPYIVVGHDDMQFRTHFRLGGEETAPGTIVARMETPEPVRIYDPLRQPWEAATIPRIDPCPCGLAR